MHSGTIVLCGLLASMGSLSQAQVKSSVASGVSSMNPDISLNVLTLYKNSKREDSRSSEPDSGLSLQETELQIQADVDPYLRASVLLSIHPSEVEPKDPTAPPASEPAERGTSIEAEEVYMETLKIPYLSLKYGRFRSALGRHNQLHVHAYPFIDAPLIQRALLGEEGLSETGLSASALVPLPWFLELTAQAVQGDSPALFASESSSDLASIIRVRNLFELSDSATLDLGFSGAGGANFYGERTSIEGADVTLKWRPSEGGKYQSLIWVAEYLKGDVKARPIDPKLAGYATWIQYQFAERWWIQARTEAAAAEGGLEQTKVSALIAFFPSEFSGFRLQVDQVNEQTDKALNTLMLQANVTIGAHPAHTY